MHTINDLLSKCLPFRRNTCLLALGLAFAAGSALAATSTSNISVASSTPNVLLVIIDDIGPEQLGAYASDNIANAAPATTPRMDALAANGVRFKNAWGFPVCSPSRAAMYTGRYPLRTGVGAVIDATDDNTLSSSETTVAEVTKAAGLSSALIGKWHLGENAANGGTNAPRVAGGFDTHSGTVSGAISSYTKWVRYLDGVKKIKPITTYATTYQADDAYNFASQYNNWFVTLSLNAPHSPYHIPTNGLYSQDLTGISDCNTDLTTKRKCYKASLEALDTELGRLLDKLDSVGKLSNTMVIIVGDNGTPSDTVDSGVDRTKAKGTVYQRGLRVPMIISGPSVLGGGRVVNDVVSVTDVFATIAELTGQTQTTGVDSVSMLPYINNTASSSLRTQVYAETFSGNSTHNGDSAMRDARYKLIESEGVYIGFYDLQNDPEETNNLLNTTLDATAQASLNSLKAAFDQLHGH